MARDEINAFLGAATEYQGDLTFKGAVRIDGKFTGTIVSDGTLIVGQDAKIEGTITVAVLVSNGNIKGEAKMSQQSIFHKTARFEGRLTTPSLAVEEGAQLDGQIIMTQVAQPQEPSQERQEQSA